MNKESVQHWFMNKIYRPFRDSYDAEHEQGLIRLGLVTIMAIYIAFTIDDAVLNQNQLYIILGFTFFILYAIAMLVHITRYPGKYPLRRYLGMFTDFAAITLAMSLTEEYGAPFYTVLLWAIFGYGIRFGERYLIFATISALFSFIIVSKVSTFWELYPTLTYGLLIGLIVLPTFVYVVLQKLTDVSRQAQAASRAKSRFLASMSHELRTPLNGVTSMAQLLLNTQMSQEQRNIATTIDSSAKTLQGIVENILDISTLDAGESTLNKAEINIHHVINTVTTILSPGAEAKGLYLHVYMSPKVPFLLYGDGDRLKQILFNLIGNAIKFTDQGSVTIILMLHKHEDDKVHIRISVRDTGIGISHEAQGSIFDIFSQEDTSTTRRYGGTGLGTAIARELIKSMDGNIWVDSKPGVGSTFTFEVPLEQQTHRDIDVFAENILAHTRLSLLSEDDNTMDYFNKMVAGWGGTLSDVKEDTDGIENPGHEKSRKVVLVDGNYKSERIIHLPHIIRQHLGSLKPAMILIRPEKYPITERQLIDAGYNSVIDSPVSSTVLYNALHAQLPVGLADEDTPFLVSKYSEQDLTRQSLKVLIAEDNIINQLVISRILNAAGHRTYIVEDGQAMLDVLDQQSFDVLIIDVHMPVMNGLDALKSYKSNFSQEHQCPVIMLTADTSREIMNECLQAGADSFITKPVDTSMLINAVREVTEKDTATYGAPVNPEDEDSSNTSINPRILQELEDDSSWEFIEELVSSFIQDSDMLITRMKDALSVQSYETIYELAHALKGSASNIGATRLAQACDIIVQKKRKGTLYGIGTCIDDVSLSSRQTKDALLFYLDRNTTRH